ncbi:hypothetical protein CERSUDRAFT_116605 [Gelatoporia subvermispora B]|uniref:Meiotic sister chromatid recombination protein 1 n=1 Tax=Ceriporiopsis subvermispora (strain B) TaxID=914234 RepID=M2QSW3_CERS8|nr:hypothetical protein CERSUDRAFT_116605 [Gelatoporia subvermispora B]
MRPTTLLICALAASGAHASWFGSDKPAADYTDWSTEQLQEWLSSHSVALPTGTPSRADLQSLVSSHWSSASSYAAQQTDHAQHVFQNLKGDAFDTWDESRLRQFLLEHGVVNPSGPREQLALLAKQKWTAASRSASSLGSTMSSSASSLGGEASARASKAVYGDTKHQASKSASSVYAQATEDVARAMDDTKDYVYSTWDDNRLRAYLEERGVIESNKPTPARSQLLAWMRDTYVKATNPIWHAWSDSYIHEWLVRRGIIKSEEKKKREQYLALMEKYYYDQKDTAYSSWDESQTKQWLVDHGIIKSNAQIQREKLQKLISDNYANAHDTVWSAWRDNDMRDWLIEHGYIRSDAQKTRDELVKLMQDKYGEYSARTAPYLVWPDARLRAFLREHGVSEAALPTSRPGLLQEVRIRYVQTTTRAEALYARVKELVEGGVEVAEDKIGKVLDVLTGSAESAKERAAERAREGSEWAKNAHEQHAKETKVEL